MLNKIHFVFWEGIISPHRSSFLRNLAEIPKVNVMLIVEKEISTHRLAEGWIKPNLGSVTTIVNPNFSEIETILKKYNSSIHIVNGFHGCELGKNALKYIVKNNMKLGICSEAYDWTGLKGKLRYLRSLIDYHFYKKHVQFIMAIGKQGKLLYEKAGFHKNIIFDWAYQIESIDPVLEIEKTTIPTLIFVGKLNKQKGIINLLNSIEDLVNTPINLKIIGAGPLKKEVLECAKKSIHNVKVLGVLSNDIVQKEICKSDLLVLPSTSKEGWGAVISESLAMGVPVVSSAFCGASILLNGNVRGAVFTYSKTDSLTRVLRKRIKVMSDADRIEIRNWATNISGIASAKYFMEIHDFIYKTSNLKPKAPWID